MLPKKAHRVNVSTTAAGSLLGHSRGASERAASTFNLQASAPPRCRRRPREKLDRKVRLHFSERLAPLWSTMAKLDPASVPKPLLERVRLPSAPVRSLALISPSLWP
jgi:hypothetical protein